MTRRQATRSIVANPVLVGAVTVLVTTVAVFLSYNANKGLPFVPTRQLEVALPNGANLLPGNDVREGGFRIGLVESMRPQQLPNGEVGAVAVLKLDMAAGGIPEDTVVAIRPRSLLGLKYVDIRRGTSEREVPDGGRLDATRSRIPVELDEFFGTFDRPTREASQRNLLESGNAFALRGADLNETIAELPRLLLHLEPVARTLAESRLDRFFGELGDAARITAPVADEFARSFTTGANVFEAWSRFPDELAETIRRSVPTLEAGITSLRAQRPFLTSLASFSRNLRVAAEELPTALPRLTPALIVGTDVQRRTPEINRGLRGVFRSAERLFEAPGTGIALRGLNHLASTLNPTLRFLGPYVTVCNYFNYAFTHLGEHVTEPDPTGTAQRTLLNQAPRQTNSPGSIGATERANGEGAAPGSNPAYFHGSVYGAAVTGDGKADCEMGQRGYLERKADGNPNLDLKIVEDPRTPGVQGPTYTGLPEVPEGQTFTREPEFTPQLPPLLLDED